MSSPSENFVVNASQLSDIVKDWIDSAIESGTRNAQEWLKQKLQEKIPNLDSATTQSLASDISDYAKSISSFREDLDLAKVKHTGMSRQEWLYRKLKDIAGENAEKADRTDPVHPEQTRRRKYAGRRDPLFKSLWTPCGIGQRRGNDNGIKMKNN